MSLLDEIPGYKEAVDRESLARDAAFLGIHEDINGFEVLPMTVRHYLTLRATGSTVIFGKIPDAADLFRFLWILSPDFQPQDCRARRKLFKRIRKLSLTDMAQTVIAARKYLLETFWDRPSRKDTDTAQEASYFSDACSLSATFGREYGWTIETTMALPMKCAFQLLKEIRQQRGAKVLFNPSDRIKSDWLEKVNSGNN